MIVKSANNCRHQLEPTANGKVASKITENGIKYKDDSHKPLVNNHELKSSTSEAVDTEDDDKPLTVNIEINSIAWLLFAVGFAFRFYRLSEPSSVVFDELHYGKFVSLYLRGVFFFDSQPPLGKQLIALSGYIAGYNGDYAFNAIGEKYDPNVPLKALRFVPTLFGALIIPTVYHLMVAIGSTHRTAALAALLIILDNALLTQSRFILMDTILIFFSLFGVLSFVIATKKRPFSHQWFCWLITSSVFVTFGVCVKYIGIISLFLIYFAIFYDFWAKIADKTIRTLTLWFEFVFYVFNFVVLPLFIYLAIFYVHLSMLTNAGPHDNIMTSAFQASLQGGLASITKGQPLEIAHGSQVTLRHTDGRACWLHSHQQLYPIRYPDNRGSSHQQQVTCYSFKDVNNWWIVKRPENNELVISDPIDRIKDGDVVQLVHGMSGRALNSHDVAAPVSPQNQEVSCYIDYNISMPAQNLWRVKLLNKDETNGFWHTISSRVQLIHVNTSQALKFSGKQLPDWGYNQHEVVTDKNHNQEDAVWNVEEHRYTKNSDAKERERDMGSAEFVPLKPTQLSFLDKMIELQYKMLVVNQENVQNHIYSCDSPLDWITLTKGIAYWVGSDDNSQIHLIGNIVLWYSANASMVLYLILLLVYVLRRKRKFYDISDRDWNQFVRFGQFLFVGYVLYVIPYFLSERTLFLHHYLPALVFKIMLMSALIDHLKCLIPRRFLNIGLMIIIATIGYAFVKFLPLSYGTGRLTASDVQSLKWRSSWQLIVHKP